MPHAASPLQRYLRRLMACLFLAIASGASLAGTVPSSGAELKVLSSAPEWVSGGSALVQLRVSTAQWQQGVHVRLDQRPLSPSWQPTATTDEVREFSALIGELDTGTHHLTVYAKQDGRLLHRLRLDSWPQQGPVFSGPQQTPFFCQTESFVLPDGSTAGPALDAQCSIAARVHYLYKPKGAALKPLTSIAALPADVETVTTLAGVTMPFVVRVETATVDRGIYQSAVLHDPTRESAPSPWQAPTGWNRRLIAITGTGCTGGWYVQGASRGSTAIGSYDFQLLSPARLGEGYALFTNTLLHPTHNCNPVLASEAATMSKEYFVKRHGRPDFTLSGGCSGGSYTSALAADRIPGLFDGLLLTCTFTDPFTLGLDGADSRLLARLFRGPLAGQFSTDQILAIAGHKSVAAFESAARTAGRLDPVTGRQDVPGYSSGAFQSVVPVSQRYDAVKRPDGLRGTLQDATRNVLGTREAFAAGLFDNTGVAYGLSALRAGVITPEQFLLINEQVGGYDHDANFVARRNRADPGAVHQALRSGLLLRGNGGLAAIPIMDASSDYTEDDGYHYQWHHFALRERLRLANGDTRNHVMWRGNPAPGALAWSTLVQWVADVAQDQREVSQRKKVLQHKPATAVDACWSTSGQRIDERQTRSSAPDRPCNQLWPSWSAPRLEAGGPLSADILRCPLRTPQPEMFAGEWTATQWQRLLAVFPQGVCHWHQPATRTGVAVNASFGPAPTPSP